MTILQGDIQFVKTQVMDDVPEGGGGPTGVVVPSGVSNAIFPDISESDRAIGNVRMRKLVLGVRTDNTDTLLGTNIVLAEPPNDANVDMCLFSTGDMFDERVDAVARLEAYLSIGTAYPGQLFGNHIAGQNTLLIYQKTDEVPFIGATLVLVKREGFTDQHQEYVRVTEASSQRRTFEDQQGTFDRYVVTLKLQNILSTDFAGFDMSRFEPGNDAYALKTKISDTVVADAARYYGVKRLEVDAEIGDFTIKAESMFSQLVPSAQVETPIADARTNQLNGAVVSSGGPVVQRFYATFTRTSNLFIGGGIAPNSLSIANLDGGAGATVVTDAGGRLLLGGAQVGTVDYENGVLSLNTDVFGSGGNYFMVTYAPGATPQTVVESQGFEITAENRSLSYVRTIEPPPVPGTMTLSYMSAGRWYVLRDDGSGALRGASTAFGAGFVNPTSGTMSATLGALPDVGSALLLTWVQPIGARDSTVLQLDNNGKLYWPMNSNGDSTLEPGDKVFRPNGVAIQYGSRVVTDDGLGNLVSTSYPGQSLGDVNYGKGTLRLSLPILPPKGTQMQLTMTTNTKSDQTIAITGASAGGTGSFGTTDITPGTVSFRITAQVRGYTDDAPLSVPWGGPSTFSVADDGAGVLMLQFGDAKIRCGTVDYIAGTFKLLGAFAVPAPQALLYTAFDNIQISVEKPPTLNLMNQLLSTGSTG